MGNSSILYILIAASFTGFLAMMAARFLLLRRYHRQAGRIRFMSSREGKNRLYLFSRAFQALPFFKREFNRVHARIRILYPSDEISVNREVTKTMLTSFTTFAAIVFAGIFLSGGDLFYILFGVFIAAVFFKSTTTGKLERAEYRLLSEFSEFISGLIPTYRECHGHLEDAVYSMIDDLPSLIGMHLSVIYEILVSPEIEAKAERYVDYAPNRFLLSFVSLAVPVKVYGDKVLPDGNTAFLKGLMNLKKELNEELLKQANINLAFSSLTVIAVAVVVVLKPLEWFFRGSMPELASFFGGAPGIICTAIIFVVSYVCYSLVVSLKNTRRTEIRENTIWSRIAARPQIDELLNIQMSRHYTRWIRTEKALRATGDHTGVKAFAVRSAACAVGAFLLANILCFGITAQTKKNLLTQPVSALENTIVPSETYTSEMERVAKMLITEHKNDPLINREALAAEIRENSAYLKADDYVTPVVDAIENQVKEYQRTCFQWWYELVAIAVACIAFLIPAIFLRFKADQIQMSKEDEVNSFNLLALIFMHMDNVSVGTILEWMERFSYSYRDAIAGCIETLEMGEQKALKRLYDYDTMFEFRKFVKALMSVDDIGLEKAFADIEIQQDYYNEKRKLDNQKLISQKALLASRIAFIPLYLTVILYIILPMGVYAYTIFLQSISAFSI